MAQPIFAFDPATLPEPPKRSLIGGALSAGVDDIQGMLGAATSAVGTLTGIDTLRDYGAGVYQRNQEEAAANGRPDLETAPWREGGSPFFPWLAYQAVKQVPMIGSMMLGGAGLGLGLRAAGASMPAALETAGAFAPRALGGGGLRAGMSEGAEQAARAAGAAWARDVAGAAAVGAPLGAGSMFGEAIDRGEKTGEKPTAGDAAQALALSPFYGALEALQPAALKGLLTRGQSGSVAKRIATAGSIGAVTEMPTEAAQTALEMSFRPDLSAAEKANQIVDAAITGGLVGGALGGAGGLRRFKTAEPSEVKDADLQTIVDEALAGPAPIARAAPGEIPNTPKPPMDAAYDIQTREARPLGNVSTDELLAKVREFETAATQPDAPADNLQKLDLARNELFRRAEELPLQEQPEPLVAMQMGDMQRALDEARANGQATPEIEQEIGAKVAALNQELVRRSGAQPTLPIDLPVQTRDPVPTEPNAAQKRAMEIAGATKPNTRFLASLTENVKDDADLYNAVQEALAGSDTQKADTTQSTLKIAQQLGIVDDQFNDRDVVAEFDAIQKPLAQAWEKARRNPGMAKQAQKLQAQANELRSLVQLRQQAEERRAAPVAPAPVAEAPVAPVTPTAPADPTNTVMRDKLTPVVRQAEFDQAQQAVRDRDYQNAVVQRATETPARFSVEEVSLGDPVRDPARRKTMGAINSLPVEAQDRILAQFDNNPQTLIEYVRRQPSQKAARRRLAEVAGVDPVVFDSAPAPAYDDRLIRMSQDKMSGSLGFYARDGYRTVHAAEDMGIVARPNSTGGTFYAIVDSDGQTYTLAQAVEAFGNVPQRQDWLTRAAELVNADIAEQKLLEERTGGPLGGVTGNVGRSDSISPELAATLSDWMDYIGLNGVKVWLVDPKDLTRPDAQTRYNLYGRYSRRLAPDANPRSAQGYSDELLLSKGEWLIAVDQEQVTGTELFEVIAHELGHIIKATAYYGADIQTRNRLINAYHEYLSRVMGSRTARELIEASRPYQVAQRTAGQYERSGITPDPRWVRYLTGFNEWFADNVAKWATTTKEPVSIIDKFFANVAAKFRLLMDIFRFKGATNPLPAKEMVDFIKEMKAGSVEIDPTAKREMRAIRMGEEYMTSGLTPERMNDASKRLMSVRDTILDSVVIQPKTLSEKLRNVELYVTSLRHLAKRYGRMFTYNGRDHLQAYYDALEEKGANAARMAQSHSDTFELGQKLRREDRKGFDNTIELMTQSELQMDGSKPWEAHTWLMDRPNASELRAKHAKFAAIYKDLASKTMKDGTPYIKVYEDAKTNLEAIQYGGMVVGLRDVILANPTLVQQFPSFTGENPMDVYREKVGINSSPTVARDFWKGYLNDRLDEVRQYLAMQVADLDNTQLTERGRREIERRINPLQGEMRSIDGALSAMEKVPYFHLGRHGDYFVSFNIRRTEDGNADPRAQNALIKALAAKGFEGVTLTRENQKANVYVRVENPDVQDKLYRLAVELQKQNVLDRDVEVKRSKRTDSDLSFLLPEQFKRFIESVAASFEPSEGMTKAEIDELAKNKARTLSALQQTYLDMTPDNSVTKVMVRREDVPGYSGDMMRNFSFRMQVGINALVNRAASSKISEAFTGMKAARDAARSNPAADPITMDNVLQEVERRETERPQLAGRSVWDTLRAANHAYFLGLSPSYVIINMTQLGVLLWPELAKTHGFVDSGKTIARVTKLASKVMVAVLAEGKALGPTRMADAVINENVLKRAGIKGSDAQFIMDIVSRGVIDIGSAARELGRAADGNMDSKTDLALRYASAFGYYSETYTRLIAALASRDLYDKKPVANMSRIQYAQNIVNETMLNYQQYNQARALGKMGVAGPVTPVMGAFYTYTAQLLEKMYREMDAAFISRDASPEARKQARTFLLGHVAVIGTIAGTMGLPFASVAFRVAEKLVDAFGDDDDEPIDLKAAYRNYLADIFGKDVAEVIARGLPRVAGFDISQRAGEADILPFTRLLTDRRRWEDATKEWALNMFGAPASMVNNVIQGGRDIGNGDVLEGAKKMLPVAFKGPMEAFSLTDKGYVDKQGNKLPMTPGALSIAWQLLGFTPAEKAEYNEARLTQIARRGEMTRAASDLRRKIATAIEAGDNATAQDLVARARAFDQANPAFAVLPSVPGALQQRARARALAEAAGTPIGVSPKDMVGRTLTNYANY